MIGIFGAAGAIGKSVAAELTRRGARARVVGRQEAALKAAFGDAHEIVSADLSKLEDAKRAAQGLSAIVYAVGVPYMSFEVHPLLMQVTVDAARDRHVGKLIVMSNVYSYGIPQTQTVDETHSRQPHTFKGKMRKAQEDIALDAHSDDFKTIVLRLPDFFGPDADNSLAHEWFSAARDRKPAPVFAPIDTRHEWIFTPDAGPVILDLLDRNGAFGTAYNLAGPGTMATREFVTRVFEEFGERPKLRVLTAGMLRVIGLFSPLLREMVEMQYLQSDPVILDDSKLAQTLGGVKKTTYIDGIAQTVRAYAAAPKA